MRFFTAAEVAEMLDINKVSFVGYVNKGRLPKPTVLAGKSFFYDPEQFPEIRKAFELLKYEKGGRGRKLGSKNKPK